MIPFELKHHQQFSVVDSVTVGQRRNVFAVSFRIVATCRTEGNESLQLSQMIAAIRSPSVSQAMAPCHRFFRVQDHRILRTHNVIRAEKLLERFQISHQIRYVLLRQRLPDKIVRAMVLGDHLLQSFRFPCVQEPTAR